MLSKGQKKQFDDILNSFTSLVPNIEINEQPKSSLNILLSFEKKYGYNTDAVVYSHFNVDLPMEVMNEWCRQYTIYCVHKGDYSLLNTIK